MTETVAEEMSLLPDERPEQQSALVPLSLLPPNHTFEGERPDQHLIDWIDAAGVFVPISVSRRSGSTRYHVHDGRRRIQAVRILADRWEGDPEANPWTHIPAIVVDDQHYMAPEMLALMLHATRKENPHVELSSVQRLVAKGYSEEKIAKESGYKLTIVRKRMSLLTLDKGLRDAVNEGKMKFSVAEKAVKLSPQAQKRLLEVYKEKGKITGKDVEEQNRARTQQAASSVTLSGLSDLPGIDAIPDPTPGLRGATERSSAPSEAAREAISYLQGRVESATGAKENKRVKWSQKDVEMVTVLIKELS